MNINTILQKKLFKKTCERLDKVTSPVHSDGSYHPFECLLNPDKAKEIIKCQSELYDIINLVDKQDIKEFENSTEVKDGINILKGIAKR